ncbi:MAG: deoxyhypusine synthase family protein [Acidaminococcaceae bacterium]|nr:deoxyhypusine synthase family protein [Acidaminococcaceae bacterium]
MSNLFGVPHLEAFWASLDESSQQAVSSAIQKITDVKKRGGKVMVVTGSGPNIHEGVTTLIAELIRVGIVDAVSTSSAVIAHEMAGSLDRVFRVDAQALGMDMDKMPRGDVFEFTCMSDEEIAALKREMPLDDDLLERGSKLPKQNEIIKAAGNMAYPMGLRTERVAHEVMGLARMYGLPFETVAGWGCDEHTMLGAAAKRNVPVLVTIPQMIGGGAVGMSIGDSIPVSQRSMRISRMLADCDVIIESAVALTQEIHDGPFECYTGHGIWAWWSGQATYNLRNKNLIRIDLDSNLRRAVELNKTVQEAIDKGLPKTKAAKIPFRMEMSAFARHEGSIPIVGDIGKVWPLIASGVAKNLGIELEFLSASQDTAEGTAMREWIVGNVKAFDREKMLAHAKEYKIIGK